MDKGRIAVLGLSFILLATGAACGKTENASSSTGIIQTRFPGQVTAGGGTSGDVLARLGEAVNATYSGGTPGIAGGAGGTTGGPATGGTVQESGHGPSSVGAKDSSNQQRSAQEQGK
jgi:hypothetical protein